MDPSNQHIFLGVGTTEFTKMEGITFSSNHGDHGRIYISISRVENSMEDSLSKGKSNTLCDAGGPDPIRLAAPLSRTGYDRRQGYADL